MEERRKYVRIPENSKISYKCVSKEHIDEQLTKDVSQGGIRFVVHDFIPKDSYLKMRLTLSRTSASFEAMVRVVWTRRIPYKDGYEVGVQFVDISPQAVQLIVNYIKVTIDERKKSDNKDGSK